MAQAGGKNPAGIQSMLLTEVARLLLTRAVSYKTDTAIEKYFPENWKNMQKNVLTYGKIML